MSFSEKTLKKLVRLLLSQRSQKNGKRMDPKRTKKERKIKVQNGFIKSSNYHSLTENKLVTFSIIVV